jgi:hypothetical protein
MQWGDLLFRFKLSHSLFRAGDWMRSQPDLFTNGEHTRAVTKSATKCRQCWAFGADFSVSDSDCVSSCKEIVRRKNNLTRSPMPPSVGI